MLSQKNMLKLSILGSILIALGVVLWAAWNYYPLYQKYSANKKNPQVVSIFDKKPVDIRETFEGIIQAYEPINHQIEPSYVSFFVPVDKFARIHEAMHLYPLLVEVQDMSPNAMAEEGFIEYVSQPCNFQDGRVEMRAVLTNKNATFMPGQLVKVSLVLHSLDQALVLSPRDEHAQFYSSD